MAPEPVPRFATMEEVKAWLAGRDFNSGRFPKIQFQNMKTRELYFVADVAKLAQHPDLKAVYGFSGQQLLSFVGPAEFVRLDFPVKNGTPDMTPIPRIKLEHEIFQLQDNPDMDLQYV